VAAADLVIMHRIDELHLNYPFAGTRMVRDLLAFECIKTGEGQEGQGEGQRLDL
jgi:putative transposase